MSSSVAFVSGSVANNSQAARTLAGNEPLGGPELWPLAERVSAMLMIASGNRFRELVVYCSKGLRFGGRLHRPSALSFRQPVQKHTRTANAPQGGKVTLTNKALNETTKYDGGKIRTSLGLRAEHRNVRRGFLLLLSLLPVLSSTPFPQSRPQL